MTELDVDLRKVALATTLCHLCSLEQLERWAVEARKQPGEKVRPRRKRGGEGGC